MTPQAHGGVDAGAVEEVEARVDRAVRRLTAVGADLASGARGLAWRGLSRDRFDARLESALADLATTREALARAARLLADTPHDPWSSP